MRKRRFRNLSEGILQILQANGHRVFQDGDRWIHQHRGALCAHQSRWEAIFAACQAMTEEQPVQLSMI